MKAERAKRPAARRDGDHSGGRTRLRARGLILVGAGAALVVAALGFTLGAGLFKPGGPFGGPAPAEVQRSFNSYLSALSEAGYLVLAEARHELVLRDQVAGRLFGDSAVGRLLNLRSDAVIELSAYADLFFCVDLRAPWSARYDPKGGGKLSLAMPPLGFLPPALRSDSVRARAAERSIFLNEKELIDAAKAALSTRFVEAASALCEDEAIRSKAADALRSLAAEFAKKAGVKLASVDLAFAPADR